MTFIPTTIAVVTTATFTQPAIGSTVSVSVSTTLYMLAGQYLFIGGGGGFYAVTTVTDSVTVVVTNLGDAGNTNAANTITAGAALFNAGRPRIARSATVSTDESTASTSYVDLATVGPSVTLVTGTTAIVTLGAQEYETVINFSALISVAVSGATTLAASDTNASSVTATVASARVANYISFVLTGLTAGTNTFTMKYRVENASNTYHYENRRIMVSAQL